MHGKPLLARTIENARKASPSDVWCVCDSAMLADVAVSAGAHVVVSTRPHKCGTERIASALEYIPKADGYVNIQADEPSLPAEWINTALANSLFHEVSTIATHTITTTPYVSVVLKHNSRALYFSRCPLPGAYRHVGIYAYTRSALEAYCNMQRSDLEEAEDLEQLRWLQAGYAIHVAVMRCSEYHGSVDTFDDYRRLCARLQPNIEHADLGDAGCDAGGSRLPGQTAAV